MILGWLMLAKVELQTASRTSGPFLDKTMKQLGMILRTRFLSLLWCARRDSNPEPSDP